MNSTTVGSIYNNLSKLWDVIVYSLKIIQKGNLYLRREECKVNITSVYKLLRIIRFKRAILQNQRTRCYITLIYIAAQSEFDV